MTIFIFNILSLCLGYQTKRNSHSKVCKQWQILAVLLPDNKTKIMKISSWGEIYP